MTNVKIRLKSGYYESYFKPGPKPVAPSMPSAVHFDAVLAYASELAVHGNNLVKWSDDKENSRRIKNKLRDEFMEDAIDHCGIGSSDKKYHAFHMAWERGHSAGLHEVLYELESLSELIK